MALGKLLEGTAWFATLSLATVGTLAFLPDGAWKSFPTALRPVRAKFAEFGVAPTCYRADSETNVGTNVGTDELASNKGLAKSTTDGGANATDAVWGNATTVRIGERWKNVRKVGETAFFDKERRGMNGDGALNGNGDGNGRADSVLSAALGGLEGNGGTAAEPSSIGGTNANALSGLNGGAFNGGLDPAADERNAFLNVDGAQTSSNNEVASVASAASDLGNAGVGVGESWSDDEIPPFDEGVGTSAEKVGDALNDGTFENVDNRDDVAFLVENNVAGAENNFGATAEATPTGAEGNETAETTGAEVAVGGPGFEDFGGFGDFNAPTQLLAEADAALPSDSTGNVAPNPGLDGGEVGDLRNALAAASTASTPEEIKTVFEALNRIRNEQGVRLAADEAQALDAALDRLAFDVFYNPAKAILEPRWETAPGESLASIAERLGTTPETLAEINGLKTPVDAPLPVGTTLKTVRGPVSAEISIAKKELTLRFNGLYAGRFALGVPENSANLRGAFRVVEKLANPNCDAVDANGQTLAIPGGAPENPLGAAWIALDGGVGLQGTNRPELVGQSIPENGGFVFSNREISQLSVLLPVGAVVAIGD